MGRLSDPQSARATLADLDRIESASRLAVRTPVTGLPLIGWGLAWLLGYAGLEFLPGPWGWIALVGTSVAAGIVSWWDVAQVRTGHESQLRLGWIVVMAASPFLINAAQADNTLSQGLLLGALWSLGMCLYAVATRDLPLLVLSAIAVAAAGIAPLLPAGNLIAFGLVAGPLLATLGVIRMIRNRTVRRGGPGSSAQL